MALKTYLNRKKERYKINSLSSHLRKSEKEEQIKFKVYKRKENMKIIAEIIRKTMQIKTGSLKRQ